MKSKDNIFKFIIENINSAIEENWESAVLTIKVSSNFSSYKGYYLFNNIKKNIKVSRFDEQIDLDFIDLHTITTIIDPEISKWNIAYFNLNKAGKFNIEYIWDQELQDEVDRLNKDFK